jgi:hypothetical protein
MVLNIPDELGLHVRERRGHRGAGDGRDELAAGRVVHAVGRVARRDDGLAGHEADDPAPG